MEDDAPSHGDAADAFTFDDDGAGFGNRTPASPPTAGAGRAPGSPPTPAGGGSRGSEEVRRG
ncbi:hypothetical protein ACHAXT_002654 [Thalassiosira profunda]